MSNLERQTSTKANKTKSKTESKTESKIKSKTNTTTESNTNTTSVRGVCEDSPRALHIGEYFSTPLRAPRLQIFGC